MFGEYNYVIENLTERIWVEPHYRGCICDLKPCIRLCCDDPDREICVTTDTIFVSTHEDPDAEIDLTGDKYGVLVGKTCKNQYKLEPKDYDDDKWYFLQVSSFLVILV